jgi:hypothetical protein
MGNPKKKLNVGEVLTLVKEAKTANERSEILKEHDTEGLRAILSLNFNKSYQFYSFLNEEQYVQSGNPPGMGYTSLLHDWPKIRMFMPNHPVTSKIPEKKVIGLYLQFLEALEATDAQALIDAKNKSLDVGLTKATVNKVWPTLIP